MEIIQAIFGLLILGICYFAFYIFKEEVAEPKYNKLTKTMRMSLCEIGLN